MEELMSFLRTVTVVIALSITTSFAIAAEQTVTLKVDGMTCASCPYQVQHALKNVDGVKTAQASLETHEAVVVFDDGVTQVAALIAATKNAGFPSTLKAEDINHDEKAAP